MTVSILGQQSATLAIPVLGDTVSALNASVGLSMSDLAASANVFANVGVNVSPQVDAGIFLDAAAQVVLNPPTLSVDAGVGADLNLKLGQLQAFLDLVVYLQGLRGSITVASYQGTKGNFTNEANQCIGGSNSDNTFAIVLSATDSQSVETLRKLFGL